MGIDFGKIGWQMWASLPKKVPSASQVRWEVAKGKRKEDKIPLWGEKDVLGRNSESFAK